MEDDISPRIYVASLSDYNGGRLHGVWIDADQTTAELHEAIQDMLQRSPIRHAEEWAIHDFDGFGRIHLSEFESLEMVCNLALGIVEHGEAFSALVELVGMENLDAPRFFEDRFVGRYASMEEFADQVADDLGWPKQLERLDECLHPYVSIDYSRLGDETGSGMHIAAKGGGIIVFRTML